MDNWKRAEIDIGWAIGRAEAYGDPAYQDRVESESLYELLEREIVPAFYDRGPDGLPRKWIARMKTSIAHLCPEFNIHRMSMQYANEYYLVAHRRYLALSMGNAALARDLAAWRTRIQAEWSGVRVEITGERGGEIDFGEEAIVSACVVLNNLPPNDVAVQVLVGRVDADGELQQPATIVMQASGGGPGTYLYQAAVQPPAGSGLHGYSIRVLPRESEYLSQFVPDLITWAHRSSEIPELQAR